MLSKSRSKIIRQLQQKKYRKQYGLFVVEGRKSVSEFIKAGFKPDELYTTGVFPEFESTGIKAAELKQISSFKNPDGVLAVFRIPKPEPVQRKGLTLLLDSINDPGNLGTIIRLCDWFGVDQLVCSEDTADCYNPKTVQASMGSLARLPVVYTDIHKYLQNEDRPVYATVLNGENIYKTRLEKDAVIVMGNEANGISEAVLEIITRKLSIPQFGTKHETESLNVAMATAVVLSEFKRNNP